MNKSLFAINTLWFGASNGLGNSFYSYVIGDSFDGKMYDMIEDINDDNVTLDVFKNSYTENLNSDPGEGPVGN